MEKVKEKAEKATEVTKEELKDLQTLNAQFQTLKMQLGEIELHKQSVISDIDKLKAQFNVLEQGLISKYGKDTVVNIQTGELTKKENG